MNSRTVKRYIWLLNTLLQHNGLTLKEISDKWESSCLGDGEPFARRTFFVHREAIAELFGVEIACDKSTVIPDTAISIIICALHRNSRPNCFQWVIK